MHLDLFPGNIDRGVDVGSVAVSQDGGMKVDDAKRLKELEAENVRLKKLLGEAEPDKAMLGRTPGSNRSTAASVTNC